jgi:hypothetical protein
MLPAGDPALVYEADKSGVDVAQRQFWQRLHAAHVARATIQEQPRHW